MNDRELLEMAAKSIGKKINEHADQDGKFRFVEDGVASWGPGYWNPLEDDGNALRLAVSLRISLLCAANNTACDIPRTDEYVWEEAIDGSAARRSIVRAAAEIGKSMEGK